jgi:hypothetical protein
MTTTDNFRKLALALPEAEERDHRGHPSFCVRGKIFATLWPAELRGVLKLAAQDQADLIRTHSKAFSLNAWSKQGWTDLHLEHVTATECKQLLEEAWRHVAPKKLVKSHDADQTG